MPQEGTVYSFPWPMRLECCSFIWFCTSPPHLSHTLSQKSTCLTDTISQWHRIPSNMHRLHFRCSHDQDLYLYEYLGYLFCIRCAYLCTWCPCTSVPGVPGVPILLPGVPDLHLVHTWWYLYCSNWGTGFSKLPRLDYTYSIVYLREMSISGLFNNWTKT